MNKEPKPGDLIEIYRGAYNHWAIYVGGGYVVHFLGPGIVKKEKLQDVVKNDPWIINNSLDDDDEHKPRKPEEIVSEAHELVGKRLPYNFITNNCEHFVKKLRYGAAMSGQVEEVARGGLGGAVGGFAKRVTMRMTLDIFKSIKE